MPRLKPLVMHLNADLDSVETAVGKVLSLCRRTLRDERRFRLNLRVGIKEALTNAVLYGAQSQTGQSVRVEVRNPPGRIVIKVTDQGNGFDHRTLEDPRTRGNVGRERGRGVFLMRKLMDEVRFNRAGNSVTMVLRERPAESSEHRAQARANDP